MNRFHMPPVARRWRFVAAVVGVAALAGGGVLLAAPSDPATALAFHTVTTVRVLDTRAISQVGPRSTPLGLAGTVDLVIPGLPDDATGVNLNVTAVDGTEGSFLTVYPTGDARPLTSTVNWDLAGAVANTATVVIHPAHSVTIYNLKGTVNVVVDLLGYYAPSPAGAGATGPQGPQGIPGTGGSAAHQYASHAANQLVVSGFPIAFADVGSGSGGITPVLDLNSAAIGFDVTVTGVYKVSFGIVADSSNQVRLLVDGATPQSMLFGADLVAGAAAAANNGTAVMSLTAGDEISLVNQATPKLLGDLNLITAVGGAGFSLDGWILIEQLS